jgi:hypothetical protein
MLRTGNRSNRRKCDRVAFPQCSGLDCAAQRTSRIHASACCETTVSQCVIEGGGTASGAVLHRQAQLKACAGVAQFEVGDSDCELLALNRERRSRSLPPNSPPSPAIGTVLRVHPYLLGV